MCGRFVLTLRPSDLAPHLHPLPILRPLPTSTIQSYNIAPTTKITIYLPTHHLSTANWGIHSNSSRTPHKHLIINTRAEKISALSHPRRCVIPAKGYYEWARGVPWYVKRRDGGVMLFAGVLSAAAAGGEVSIVTTEASEGVRKVHGRMPAVLEVGEVEGWFLGGGVRVWGGEVVVGRVSGEVGKVGRSERWFVETVKEEAGIVGALRRQGEVAVLKGGCGEEGVGEEVGVEKEQEEGVEKEQEEGVKKEQEEADGVQVAVGASSSPKAKMRKIEPASPKKQHKPAGVRKPQKKKSTGDRKITSFFSRTDGKKDG